MVVSIRRFAGDDFLPKLMESAAPRKTWFKTIDNYQTYLESNSDEIKSNLSPSFLAKFLAYIETELLYQPVLQVYASRISALRNNYSVLLTYNDCNFLLGKIENSSFPTVFRQYLIELNNDTDYRSEYSLNDEVPELIKLLKYHHPDQTLFLVIG